MQNLEDKIGLESKLTQLHALLLAVTGSRGPAVFEELGIKQATNYLFACEGLVSDCLELVTASKV